MYNDFELKIPGNTGLQNEVRYHPSDLVLGAVDNRPEKYSASRPALMKDGHGWTNVAPTPDIQALIDGDTNGCVSFSGVNCCQYAVNLLMRDTNVVDYLKSIGMTDVNGLFEANNAIVTVGSGTDPNAGNTVTNVAEWIRKKGLAPMSARPWNRETHKADFYNPLNQAEINAGQPFLKMFAVEHEWVPTQDSVNFGINPLHSREQLKNALQYGVINVSVDGNYARNEDGLVSSTVWANNKRYTFTHRVTIRDYEEGQWWEVHDHYTNQIIKFVWDYPFGNGKLYFVKKKNIPMTPFLQCGKDLYFLSKGGQTVGYHTVDNGDTWKAVFGDYVNATPITKVDVLPANISGKILKLI